MSRAENENSSVRSACACSSHRALVTHGKLILSRDLSARRRVRGLSSESEQLAIAAITNSRIMCARVLSRHLSARGPSAGPHSCIPRVCRNRLSRSSRSSSVRPIAGSSPSRGALQSSVQDWSRLVNDLSGTAGDVQANAAARAVDEAERLLRTAKELARRAAVQAALG